MVFSWFRRGRGKVVPSAAPEPEVDSGCTGVCELDMATQLCKGCMRTISEIGNWRHMNADQKMAVNDEAAARKAATD